MVGGARALSQGMVVCVHCEVRRERRAGLRCSGMRTCATLLFGIFVTLCFVTGNTAAQSETPEWQTRARKYAESQNWAAALWVVDQQIARSPHDADLWAWRARILSWS